MSDYIAGACNIGPAEIKQRKRVAYLGAVVFLAYGAWLVSSDASTQLRLTAFLPAIAATTGYIQARRKFCVAFGFMGVFNFEKVGSTRKITVNQDLLADRALAKRILLQAMVSALVLTAVVVVL